MVESNNKNNQGTNPGVYNNEYFCLTNENFLLVKRKDKVLQIKPSEFCSGDLLQTVDNSGQTVWASAVCTPSKVCVGEKLVRLDTLYGRVHLTTGHKLFDIEKNIVAAGNLNTNQKLWKIDYNSLPNNQSIGINLAYILGVFSAEGSHQEGLGSTGNGQWRLIFTLQEKEDSFATKIIQSLVSLDTDFEINPIKKVFPEYTRLTVGVYSKKCVEWFKDLGATGLCYEKRVPSCIFTATEKEKAAYLAGLFEGDGKLHREAPSIKLTSKALVDGIVILLSSLGIDAKSSFAKSTNPQHKDAYIVDVYGKENIRVFVRKVGKFLYNWKHFQTIKEYSDSEYGNCKYTKKDVAEALKKHYPISLGNFYKLTKIGQYTIERLYGSWNKCLLENDLEPKNSRWGLDYSIDKEKIDCGFSKECKIRSISFETVQTDTIVYDFTVPQYKKFLIGNIVSHNSGAQVSLYIGDVWVDEVTSIEYNASQSRMPLYGYADQLFRGVAEGQVVVRGRFSINFKEAGYLWLILNRYKQKMEGRNSLLNPFVSSGSADRRNIEQVINNEVSQIDLNSIYTKLASDLTENEVKKLKTQGNLRTQDTLTGFASSPRLGKNTAESIFETFEDIVWGEESNLTLAVDATDHRRADDTRLNPFDIYIAYGDFAGDNTVNHTIRRIADVYIMGTSQQVVIDGQPIQEIYDFIGRNII